MLINKIKKIVSGFSSRILNRNKGWKIILSLISFLTIVFSLIFLGLVDLFTILIILYICLLLFYSSFVSRYNLLLKITSIFIFLHLIAFPVIYIIALNSNNRSFGFDSDVEYFVKQDVKNELFERYNPEGSAKNLSIIEDILASRNTILDSNVSFLNRGNVILLEKYLIYQSVEPGNSTGNLTPRPHPILIVCEQNGDLLTKIKASGFYKFRDEDISIKKFLEARKYFYTNEMKKYTSNYDDVVSKRKIWTYTRLLPYVINIFFNENLTPKTKTANILYFTHYIIVIFLILVLIGNLLSKIIIEQKK